jgi:hypothetical protein
MYKQVKRLFLDADIEAQCQSAANRNYYYHYYSNLYSAIKSKIWPQRRWLEMMLRIKHQPKHLKLTSATTSSRRAQDKRTRTCCISAADCLTSILLLVNVWSGWSNLSVVNINKIRVTVYITRPRSLMLILQSHFTSEMQIFDCMQSTQNLTRELARLKHVQLISNRSSSMLRGYTEYNRDIINN